MSFVDHYLPYFMQWLLALLPFQALFTESLHGDQLLDPPRFSGAFNFLAPLLCASFQFIVYSGFFWGRGSVCPVGYAGLFLGGWRNTM
jgi:hypothetical protein